MEPLLSANQPATTRLASRWLALAIAFLAESISGMIYAFSLYSDNLQAQFNLTQSELDMLGTASNWGGNFGIHVGLLLDVVGPQYTMLLGGVLGSASWLLFWAALAASKQAVAWVPYAALFLLSFLLGHAQLIADCVSVTVVDAHFPGHRGRALGLTKAFVGLSGSLVTMIYQVPTSLPHLRLLVRVYARGECVCAARVSVYRWPHAP